jgi:hypothetical protein
MLSNTAIAEKFYKELESNIISIVFAKKNADFEKKLICENKIIEIMDDVYNSNDDIKDCFRRLLVAEYKEKIYWSIYDCKFDSIEHGILVEYDIFFESDSTLYNVLMEHLHDPTHYMFSENNPFYSFYEMVESKGLSIFDKYNDDE